MIRAIAIRRGLNLDSAHPGIDGRFSGIEIFIETTKTQFSPFPLSALPNCLAELLASHNTPRKAKGGRSIFTQNSSWRHNYVMKNIYFFRRVSLFTEKEFQNSVTRLGLTPLLFLVVLTACGGGNSDPPSSGSIAGNWQMSLQNNPGKTPSGFLLQTGNALNGSFLFSGNCAGVGPAQGAVSGSNISMTVSEADQVLSLTGTASADGSSMSGNYTVLASGCGGPETGTWNGSQVKALTGNFQGVFTSTVTNDLVFHFTGNLTQGPNTGASYASLSGSMTSTDASCFTSSSISGQITGTSAVLNLATSEGVSLGKISTTLTADATSMTGTYAFINTQVPLACGSDYGTVVFTIQPSATM
jgi:hypothetical protein